MRVRRTALKSVAAIMIALLMAVTVAPAFAADGDLPPVDPTIVAGVTLGGIDVSGLTASSAREALLATAGGTSFAPVPVVAGTRVFSLDASSALSLDVDGMVAEALVATQPLAITVRYVVSTSTVTAFVSGMAAAVDRKAIDAKRSISHRRLKLSASTDGLKLDRAVSVALLTEALASEAAGSASSTVTVPVAVIAPKTTSRNIGKTIIVSLREYKVLLYNGTKVEKTYRCAIGMRRYPTPVGTFKVINKSAAPTWRNPYSSWSRKMPAFIRPGYYNPLGLRALYINSPGIRIHGTSKSWSMGHAASHGCIRLTNRSVVDIYPRVKVGTPVYILK